MTASKVALLPDRAIVEVAGADAKTFLDNMITNDLEALQPEGALFAGLLSPQGKILFDFIIVAEGSGYLLDVAKDQAAALTKRLSMYKLRAQVSISELTAAQVTAHWPATPDGAVDPRAPDLGCRSISVLPTAFDQAAYDAYHARRIALGVPEGGKDYAFGDAFAHEALFDQLNGVSFTKGCYVGQEIVARMEHRGTARKRIVRVVGEGPLPVAGTEVLAGEVAIGAMGSSANAHGLAMLRLDRVAEFAGKGVGLTCGGVRIVPDAGDVARLMPKAAE